MLQVELVLLVFGYFIDEGSMNWDEYTKETPLVGTNFRGCPKNIVLQYFLG
jgi:hypothetical protein